MLDLSPDEWVAIRLSLKIAVVATAAALPFGLAVAWLLARRSFWGMALCFAKALGEFGATITFVSNIPGETQTISAAIYSFTQIPGGDAAAGRLVAVAIVISLAALVAAEWLARRAGMRFHGEG